MGRGRRLDAPMPCSMKHARGAIDRHRRMSGGPESGFTIVEVVVATLIAGVGLLATVAAFDTSRDLVSLSERIEAAIHIGEREVERIHSMRYGAVALDAAPAGSSDPRSPAFYVQTGPAPSYRWNQKGPTASPQYEPLVIDATAGGLNAAPTPWSDGRLAGSIHRFVTWVDDAACGALCPEAGDYKRVTVAVTIEGAGGPRDPILVSSIVADPNAKPEGDVEDGSQNPLDDPSTTCLDSSGARVECARSIGGGARTWFLYDTPASASEREPIAGDHPTHATVAPSGGECTDEISDGCPVPDLMGAGPPPTVDPLPALFDYSNEQDAAYAGGRVLRRDVDCSESPSSVDNARGELWSTAPLSVPTTFTGDGALTLYAQTLEGASGEVTLCAAFYDVSGSLSNLVARPPAEIGRASYRLGSWPTALSPVSFTFDFRGSSGAVVIPAGRRLGLRVWAARSSGADIALAYDHPLHASSLQLSATGG